MLNIHDFLALALYVLYLVACSKKYVSIGKYFDLVAECDAAAVTSRSHAKTKAVARKIFLSGILVLLFNLWPIVEFKAIQGDGHFVEWGPGSLTAVGFYLRPLQTVLFLWCPVVAGVLLLCHYMAQLLAGCFEALPAALLRGSSFSSAPVKKGLALCRAVRSLNEATWPFLLLHTLVSMGQVCVLTYSIVGMAADKIAALSSSGREDMAFGPMDRFAVSFSVALAVKLGFYVHILFAMFSVGQTLESARYVRE